MKNLKLLASSALVVLAFSIPQIHLSQAMESILKPIIFIQPNHERMVIKVNLDQPLSDLRLELMTKERIMPNDIFQQEGGYIFQNDEKDWTIREVLINNTLFLKSRDLEKPNESVVSHSFGSQYLETPKGCDLGLVFEVPTLPYVFLGEHPPINSLVNIKEGQLGLFAEGGKLYCKVSGKDQIEIIVDENAVEVTQKGLPRNIFDKIMGTVTDKIKDVGAFGFGIQMEKQYAPVAGKHYNDAYESISQHELSSLFQFVLLSGYVSNTVQSSNITSIGGHTHQELDCLTQGRYLIKNNHNGKYLWLSDETRRSSDGKSRDKVVKGEHYIWKNSIFTFEKTQQGWLIKGFDSRYVHICESDRSNGLFGDRMVEASIKCTSKCYFNIIKRDEGYVMQSDKFKDYIYIHKRELALADNKIEDQSYFSFILYDKDWF